MLGITVPAVELFDERTSKFISIKEETLLLEHSLASLSKWESLHEKPFLGKEEKSNEETLSYIKCMTISPVNDLDVYKRLSAGNHKDVGDYIDLKMTATWFNESAESKPKGGTGEVVTAEIIYYWMVSLNVPLECQHWHLNRLLTLVKVINLKNAPPKKMGRRDAAAQRKALNEQNRAKMGTRG